VKVKSLVTKHHDVGRVEVKAPHILNIVTKWRLMIIFTFWPYFHWKRASGAHWVREWNGPRAGLDVMAMRKVPASAGNRTPGRLAHTRHFIAK